MNDLVKTEKQELNTVTPDSEMNLSPLVALVAGGKINTEQLKDLLDIQREHDADVAKKAYDHAMAQFRKRVPKIKKDATVDFTSAKGRTRYNHTSLHHVVETISPILGDLGLNPSWKPDDSEPNLIKVTCILTHEAGHSERVTLSGPPDQTGNKNAIQSRASTVTQLERHTLFAICGLASSDDNDGNNGGAPASQTPKKPAIPEASFKKWYKDFQKRVEDGELTASAVVSQLQTKYTLSDEQHTSLVNLRDCEPVQK